MPNYIVKSNQVHFRQAYPRPILAALFVTLYALGITILDGDRRYPNIAVISESEFLSVLEMLGA